MATFTKNVTKTTVTVWRLDEDEVNGLILAHLQPPQSAQVDIALEIRQNSFIGATVTIRETENG